MQIDDTIVFNTIIDWKKKDIPKIAKAKLLKEYMKEKGISQNQLAKELEISKSLIHDWLSWANFSEEQYNKLKEIGYTETDLYMSLRKPKLAQHNCETDLDLVLWKLISKVNSYDKLPKESRKTREMIIEAKLAITKLEAHYKA